MTTSNEVVLKGKARVKVVNQLSEGFVKAHSQNVIVTNRQVRAYLRDNKKPVSLAQAIIWNLIRNKVIAKMGQRSDEMAPNYLMIVNLPIKPSWELGTETTSRLIGNCLNYSAEMARMTYQAKIGGANV
ncbi:hypothetical protein [Tatumella sp. OPLPL6]|uniref:hypothetical protein n=1 Tax=Tatumella sp. OPLPL6 TaxID=1928657 RepID=UPI000C56498C|nr:hypothetical protein [Tatumella sp. OPLPL6]PIJ43276.1 hypothetical protein BOM24_08885 [Tatumella sp. OPLPL6]